MIKLLQQKLFFMMLLGIFGLTSTTYAATYTYELKKNDFTETVKTSELAGITWTMTVNATNEYFGMDTKGMQIGSSKKPASKVSLSTSGFSGAITKVVVNASTASSSNGKIAVTVGGAAYGQQKSLTTSSADYEFTGSSAGELSIILEQTTSKALYIKSITVEYGEAPTELAAPVLSVNNTDFYDAFDVTITADANAKSLQYTVDGSDPVSSDTKVSVAGNIAVVHIPAATTTLRAVAIDADGKAGAEGKATYTLKEKQKNLAEVIALPNSSAVYVQLTDAVVTYVNGDNVFVTDATGSMQLYGAHTFKAGDVLNGVLTGTYELYNGVPEIKNFDTSKISAVAGTVPAPKAISAADFKSNYNSYVTLILTGTDHIIPRDSYKLLAKDPANYKLPAGVKVKVTGIASAYNSTLQILLTEVPTVMYADNENNVYFELPKTNLEIGRTVTAGQWNTIALPCALTADEIAAVFGEGTKVAELNFAVETLLEFKTVSEMSAATAYIIKPAKTTDVLNIKNVALTKIEAKTVTQGDADFVATLNTAEAVAEGSIYMANGNMLKTISGTGTIKAFRGYFVPKASGAKFTTFNIDGELTAIKNLDADSRANYTKYNLAGQRVKAGYKGIVIENGHKYLNK